MEPLYKVPWADTDQFNQIVRRSAVGIWIQSSVAPASINYIILFLLNFESKSQFLRDLF